MKHPAMPQQPCTMAWTMTLHPRHTTPTGRLDSMQWLALRSAARCTTWSPPQTTGAGPTTGGASGSPTAASRSALLRPALLLQPASHAALLGVCRAAATQLRPSRGRKTWLDDSGLHGHALRCCMPLVSIWSESGSCCVLELSSCKILLGFYPRHPATLSLHHLPFCCMAAAMLAVEDHRVQVWRTSPATSLGSFRQCPWDRATWLRSIQLLQGLLAAGARQCAAVHECRQPEV